MVWWPSLNMYRCIANPLRWSSQRPWTVHEAGSKKHQPPFQQHDDNYDPSVFETIGVRLSVAMGVATHMLLQAMTREKSPLVSVWMYKVHRVHELSVGLLLIHWRLPDAGDYENILLWSPRAIKPSNSIDDEEALLPSIGTLIWMDRISRNN